MGMAHLKVNWSCICSHSWICISTLSLLWNVSR